MRTYVTYILSTYQRPVKRHQFILIMFPSHIIQAMFRSSQIDISPEEFELLFPYYQDVEDSLEKDLEQLPPYLRLKARKMKNARKEQLKSTSAVYHVTQQMEVLLVFISDSGQTKHNEPRMKGICDEILGLLKVWDAFRRHTHESYFYRWTFRETSIKGIRRLKAYLRNQIKLAFRDGNGTSLFAEELKHLVAAIHHMLAHVNDMPFSNPPQLSDHLTGDEINRRMLANRLNSRCL